jgi:cell division protein FtsL
MAVSRSAQLAQVYLDKPHDLAWQQRRLELLQPEQEQRLAKRRWDVIPILLLVALVFAAAFAYIGLDAKIGVAGREINDINAQVKENYMLAQRTELEIGTLSSLSRIESYAKLHLDMVYPDIGAVQYLDQRVSTLLAAELAALTPPQAEPEPEAQRPSILAVLAELLNGSSAGAALVSGE